MSSVEYHLVVFLSCFSLFHEILRTHFKMSEVFSVMIVAMSLLKRVHKSLLMRNRSLKHDEAPIQATGLCSHF